MIIVIDIDNMALKDVMFYGQVWLSLHWLYS